MNFPVEDTTLANMKKLQETDDEEAGDDCDVAAETLMEVFSELDSRTITLSERGDDPLNGEDDSTTQMQFKFEYNEDDFFQPITVDKEQEYHEEYRGRKCKRPRKNGEIKSSNGIVWRKAPWFPPIADEMPRFVPSGKGPARFVSNPLEAWLLLVDIPMLNQIVKATNEVIKAAKIRQPHQKRLTDVTEIKAWLGLHYLCGVLRNSSKAGPTEELWTLELGNAIFRATMTYKRFEFLSNCVQYGDRGSDLSQPLNEVAGLWEKLVINFRSYYAPSDYCMINEQLLNLEQFNVSAFEQAFPCQLNSKGIRITTVCDSKTLYISNALIAVSSDFIEQEVHQLVSDIKGTRRCLCITECFTSMDLMQKLKQFNIQVVGAMPETATYIHTELCDGHQDPQVWYASNNLALFCCLDKHITPTRCLFTNGLSSRINAVRLYERISKANFKANECMNTYSVKYANRNSHKWTLEFLYYMLNISAFNAWILFRLSQNGNAGIEQRDFQRQLGLYLTQQQLKQRMHLNIKLSLPLKLQICEILGESVESVLSGIGSCASEIIRRGSIPVDKSSIPEGIILQTREIDNRRRCRGCKSQKACRIRTRCQQCLTPFCMRHLITRCETCSNYEVHPSNPTVSDTNASSLSDNSGTVDNQLK